MQNLYIAPTNETPEIDFRYDADTLHLCGESYPENAAAFYAPIRASLNAYLEHAADDREISAHFKLRYFNSSSTKLIRALIAQLHDTAEHGKKIVAHWYHDPDDDIMEEFGHDLKDEFSCLNFRVIPQSEG